MGGAGWHAFHIVKTNVQGDVDVLRPAGRHVFVEERASRDGLQLLGQLQHHKNRWRKADEW